MGAYTQATKNFKNQEEKFNKAFENYINAVARFDGIKSGKPVKVARMQLINAEKQLMKVDPEFATRFLAQVEKEESAKEQVRRQKAHDKRIARFGY